MLFLAIRSVGRNVGQALLPCERCVTARRFIVRRERTWLTSFHFARIFPLSELRESGYCDTCGSEKPIRTVERQLTKEEAATINAVHLFARLLPSVIDVEGHPDRAEMAAAAAWTVSITLAPPAVELVREAALQRPLPVGQVMKLVEWTRPMLELWPRSIHDVLRGLATVAAANGEPPKQVQSLVFAVAEKLGHPTRTLFDAARTSAGAPSEPPARSEGADAGSRLDNAEAALAFTKGLITVVGAMIAADGEIRDREIEAAQKIAASTNQHLPDATLIRGMAEAVLSGKVDPAAVLSEIADGIDRRHQHMLLHIAAFVARVDGDLDPSESEMLHLIGAALGMDDAEIVAVVTSPMERP